MTIKCGVCGSKLGHKRTDDGIVEHEIDFDGNVQEVVNKSNGDDEVYCLSDRNHEISQELVDKVLDLVC